MPQRKVHFLHIAKNAGSQTQEICERVRSQSDAIEFIFEGHRFEPRKIIRKKEYFFSVRNPVTRFKSGFYSRKRKGRPRYDREWSKFETQAFECFEHANDLAESLFRPDKIGEQATASILSILHTAQNQSAYFASSGHFLEQCPPLAVIRVEKFEKDISKFLKGLGLGVEILERVMPTAHDSAVHRNNYADIPELSEKAIRNLERWYAQDIAFYDMCSAWIERQSDHVA